MYFDSRLWKMMAGLRLRVAGAVCLGLIAMGFGVMRFVFLGRVLALAYQGAAARQVALAAAGTVACMLLRAGLDHRRVVLAQGTAGRVQSVLRARLFDRIAELGPAWFGAERTGGVMLAVIDGVEQLQTFFGAYVPQLVIAACAPVVIFAVLAWWDVPTAAVLLVAALATLALPMLVHNADAFVHDFTLEALEIDVTIGPGSDALVDLSAAAPGTYDYFCSLHSDGTDGMRGTVTIES